MGDAELAAVELSYLVEILTKADTLRGRTATSMVYPMARGEFDRYRMAAAQRCKQYILACSHGIDVAYPPPAGHEGRVGMWLVGVWVERAES